MYCLICSTYSISLYITYMIAWLIGSAIITTQ